MRGRWPRAQVECRFDGKESEASPSHLARGAREGGESEQGKRGRQSRGRAWGIWRGGEWGGRVHASRRFKGGVLSVGVFVQRGQGVQLEGRPLGFVSNWMGRVCVGMAFAWECCRSPWVRL